jgi:hypothetical protein
MKKKIIIFLSIASIFTAFNTSAQEVKIGITQHDFDNKLKHRVEKGQNIIVDGGRTII